MCYTVSCWILGEHGDREWVSNGRRGLIWLKHDIYENRSFLGLGASGRWVGTRKGCIKVNMVVVFCIHIWK
jgi:hypothetical protein